MDEKTLKKYRLAGKITAQARDHGKSFIREGTTLLKVVDEVESFIVKNSARVAFPVNIAIDDVAAHFTPRHNDKLVFERGNVVKLDVGAHVNGYIADSAVTVEVGTQNWRELAKASEDALMVAIEMIRPGVDLGQVGKMVEQTITSYGFKPISNLTGHSLEQYRLHAGISIPNVEEYNTHKVKPGDVLAIEPFATNGVGTVKGSRNSNIYRLIKTRLTKSRDANKLLEAIQKYRRTLPFSERFASRIVKKPEAVLSKLRGVRAVSMYPILIEREGGIITQAEHTVIVTEDGCEIIT
ncbi:MAG: type II methionyl aminopeptidase [Thermoplasmata archaeon]|nr:type II methionyl aminopeptidase [Thermoplasmata archaeon]